MVYLSDVPGMQVVDQGNHPVGSVTHVLEGAQDMLAVKVGSKELLIPWNDHFIKSIDKVERIVRVDISGLESLL